MLIYSYIILGEKDFLKRVLTNSLKKKKTEKLWVLVDNSHPTVFQFLLLKFATI